MKKILMFCIMFFSLLGCETLTVSEKYNNYNAQFDTLLGGPIKDSNRERLGKDFSNLRKEVEQTKTIPEIEKEKMLKEIDYKLMILSDLE